MSKNDSFEALLNQYRRLLFTLCRRFSRHGSTVEDLLQDASVALWQARERLFPLPAVQQAAMVWRIAHNAAIDTLRRHHAEDSLPESYETEAEDKSLINELHETIDKFDEPDRSILKMQLEGYSYEEIANKLQMTEKNVSVRLVRAKEKLRKQMTQ